MADPNDERVLCFKSSYLDEIGRWDGFTHDLTKIPLLFSPQNRFQFVERRLVEQDPFYKQIITYSIIQYGQTKDDMLIFSYTRGKSGGEDRLKKLKSLGVGGHVGEQVTSFRDPNYTYSVKSRYLDYCKLEAMREIDEEIKHTCTKPLLYLCGLINDDSNDVGKVHIGLVYRLMLGNPDIMPNETCIYEGEMKTLRDIQNNVDEYESWSQHVLRGMKFTV